MAIFASARIWGGERKSGAWLTPLSCELSFVFLQQREFQGSRLPVCPQSHGARFSVLSRGKTVEVAWLGEPGTEVSLRRSLGHRLQCRSRPRLSGPLSPAKQRR